MRLFITSLLLSILFHSCDSKILRPQPKIEIVESAFCEYEGLLDLGVKVQAKFHNFGASGSSELIFKVFTGYKKRAVIKNGEESEEFSYDHVYEHSRIVFLEKDETKSFHHIFKEITILDNNISCAVIVSPK